MYLCGLRKHNCQPFCGPEGRFHCSDSMCSLQPALFSYLDACERGFWVCWKLSAAVAIKPDCCCPPAVVSIFTDSAACVLSFYQSTPLHTIQKRLAHCISQKLQCSSSFTNAGGWQQLCVCVCMCVCVYVSVCVWTAAPKMGQQPVRRRGEVFFYT